MVLVPLFFFFSFLWKATSVNHDGQADEGLGWRRPVRFTGALRAYRTDFCRSVALFPKSPLLSGLTMKAEQRYEPRFVGQMMVALLRGRQTVAHRKEICDCQTESDNGTGLTLTQRGVVWFVWGGNQR